MMVVIVTYVVPFDSVVEAIRFFSTVDEATAFVNEESRKWWDENEGDRSFAECGGEQYFPISELGYDAARYEIWDGEKVFHAILDAQSYAMLHEAHYKREYDDKGHPRPGYLINSYIAGEKPGGLSEEEAEAYQRQQAEGLDAVAKFYNPN